EVKPCRKYVMLHGRLQNLIFEKLREISSEYILTHKKAEKELSDFINRQEERNSEKFEELWRNFSGLSYEDKGKVILRIFFFAEFWDCSRDENEDSFRNVVWNKICGLNIQNYIFRESDGYLVSFILSSLASTHIHLNTARLIQRILYRAKTFLSSDEINSLIMKICIAILNARNTSESGKFIKSSRVIECLSALEDFSKVGERDRIADSKLDNNQNYKKICQILGEKVQNDICSIIRSAIKKIKLEETVVKENVLERFINCLRQDKKSLTQLYQYSQIRSFLMQNNYYLIALAIDNSVIRNSDTLLEQILNIAKDHFCKDEMSAMLDRACRYIVSQCNKALGDVPFNINKAFYSFLYHLDSYEQYKVLEFLATEFKLEKSVDFSADYLDNIENVRDKNCENYYLGNFFVRLTNMLDACEAFDGEYEIRSFINSRFSTYGGGDCLSKLLLGEFLLKDEYYANKSQKYLILYSDNRNIAFLLTVGQFKRAKSTLLNILDEKSKNLFPNISSFPVDYESLRIINIEMNSCESRLFVDIRKEDIERGSKIKFLSINEELISLDLLSKSMSDAQSRQQVISSLSNIVNLVNYVANLNDKKMRFSFLANKKDCEALVSGLLMSSNHETLLSSERVKKEIVDSLVKNYVQNESDCTKDYYYLPTSDKVLEEKDRKMKTVYYTHLFRMYGIFSSQADLRNVQLDSDLSPIYREDKKTSIIANKKRYSCNDLHLAIASERISDVKRLIRNNQEYVKDQDLYGNTSLHFAVQKNNLEIFMILMDCINKQDQKENHVMIRNSDGYTPLHFAVEGGNVRIVEELLKCVKKSKRESYVEIANNENDNALNIALIHENRHIFHMLLECIKNPERKQYYLDLEEQASGFEKMNDFCHLDDLPIKPPFVEGEERSNEMLVFKNECSNLEVTKSNSSATTVHSSQSDVLAFPYVYSEKRPRISDENTQKPPEKKLALYDSFQQTIKVKKIEKLVGDSQKEGGAISMEYGNLSKQDDNLVPQQDVESKFTSQYQQRYSDHNDEKELNNRAASNPLFFSTTTRESELCNTELFFGHDDSINVIKIDEEKTDWIPLHVAVLKSYKETLNMKDEKQDCTSPYSSSKENSYFETAKLLLEYDGLDHNVEEEDKKAPLGLAQALIRNSKNNNFEEMVNDLLNQGEQLSSAGHSENQLSEIVDNLDYSPETYLSRVIVDSQSKRLQEY
ncbi:MAG: ankyrin repeat domain-containing protein, partial [Wolbachia endosymbiont of Meromenopon meropis]|nr:ankyrin repeat domain-containing protein [Wolbachia endosymbiont of Meromenopon meropis]